jgi:hypothetical protein
MWGGSYSASYRGIDGNTEYLGTNVGAWTNINTDTISNDSLFAEGGIRGGYIAAGVASAKTVQTTQNGFASANANGGYVATGNLNCDLNASVTGYTHTSATPTLNGSVMTSSAGMRVSANVPQ